MANGQCAPVCWTTGVSIVVLLFLALLIGAFLKYVVVEKNCPHCRKRIARSASVCPYCRFR